MLSRIPFLLFALIASLLSIRNASAAEWIDANIGGHPVRLQVVLSEAEQRKGLMETESLPANTGMLFVFQPARSVAMWMKNTPLDLDLAYLDAEARIVSLCTMKAMTTDLHESNGPVSFAIEMPSDWFRRNRVRLGAPVQGIQHPWTSQKQKRP